MPVSGLVISPECVTKCEGTLLSAAPSLPLEHNPWQCDCRLERLWTWVRWHAVNILNSFNYFLLVPGDGAPPLEPAHQLRLAAAPRQHGLGQNRWGSDQGGLGGFGEEKGEMEWNFAMLRNSHKKTSCPSFFVEISLSTILAIAN